MELLSSSLSIHHKNGPADETKHLKAAAIQLEATFLAEMLKSAGMGGTPDSFGGGAGEDQFDSFLLRAQAAEIAKAGGLGLAEVFFNSLLEREK